MILDSCQPKHQLLNALRGLVDSVWLTELWHEQNDFHICTCLVADDKHMSVGHPLRCNQVAGGRRGWGVGGIGGILGGQGLMLCNQNK